MEAEVIVYVCVCHCEISSWGVSGFVFLGLCQGPWKQGADYMTLMAQMQPWLKTLLMDPSSTEPPSCPHEFTSVTGHPSGACISASLHDPRAGGDSGPPAACLAAWQMAVWHMIKVPWEWLLGERKESWRSKVNSWLSTADFGQCEGVEAAREKWALAAGHVLSDFNPKFNTFMMCKIAITSVLLLD